MHIEYDERADAVYIPLSDKEYAYGNDLDDRRRVDYAEDGTAVGVELLFPSLGIDLHGLPLDADAIDALKRKYQFVVRS